MKFKSRHFKSGLQLRAYLLVQVAQAQHRLNTYQFVSKYHVARGGGGDFDWHGAVPSGVMSIFFV